MKNDRFDILVTARIRKIESVLKSKAGEYASDKDRLHNFKVAARIKGETPLKALDGMLVKHEVCYRDMVDGRAKLTKEFVDEKIGDFINYLILAEAVIIEEIESQEQKES